MSQDRITLAIPPWQEGWCYAFGYGINAGDVSISVAGPSVTAPSTTTVPVPTVPPADFIVRFDPTGKLSVAAGTPPPEKSSCEGYPQLVPSQSP